MVIRCGNLVIGVSGCQSELGTESQGRARLWSLEVRASCKHRDVVLIRHRDVTVVFAVSFLAERVGGYTSPPSGDRDYQLGTYPYILQRDSCSCSVLF